LVNVEISVNRQTGDSDGRLSKMLRRLHLLERAAQGG
jgi:hypothetical protein